MRPFLAFVLLSLLTIQKSLAIVITKSFPGYYITNAGDTVHAKFLPVSEDLLYREVYFADSSNNIIKFRPHQIRAFSATLPKKTFFYCSYERGFAKLLVDGPLTLIQFIDHRGYSYDGSGAMRYHLISDTMEGDIYAFTFRKDVLPFIQDCSILAAKVESRELKQKHLEEIVKQYNLWVEEKKKANAQQQPSNN